MRTPALFCTIFLVCWAAFASQPKQDSNAPLTKRQRVLADSVRSVIMVDSCCRSTLAACRKQKPDCRIAARLDTFTTWLARVDSSGPDMVDKVKNRYSFFTDTAVKAIDTTLTTPAGESSAPVLVILYVSSLCPLCRYDTRELYTAVTAGPLKGRARLMIKPFATAVGDRAVLAAQHRGKLWPFALAIDNEHDRINDTIVNRIADSMGIGGAAFNADVASPAIRAATARSKNEGIRNGIKFTPGVFINGRLYSNYKDPQWIIDAIEWEYERISMVQRKK